MTTQEIDNKVAMNDNPHAEVRQYILEIDVPRINAEEYGIGATYWVISSCPESGTYTNATAINLTFMGRSMINGMPVFQVESRYATTEGGIFMICPSVSFSDVFGDDTAVVAEDENGTPSVSSFVPITSEPRLIFLKDHIRSYE